MALRTDHGSRKTFFGAVHHRFRTPWKTPILVGSVVAIGAGTAPRIDALLCR
jgi:hypothetical protein